MQSNRETRAAVDIRKTDLSIHGGISLSHKDLSEYFNITHEVTMLHCLLER